MRLRAAGHRALERARNRTPDDVTEKLERVLQTMRAQQPARLVIRSAGKIQFVSVDEIDWIASEDNYVRSHAGQKSYLMRETVGGLEQRTRRRVSRAVRHA